jgi:cyclin-dependent kinase 14
MKIIFGILAISKEEAEDAVSRVQLPYNGYSEEFLDRLEPNGNISSIKDRPYGL